MEINPFSAAKRKKAEPGSRRRGAENRKMRRFGDKTENVKGLAICEAFYAAQSAAIW